MSLSFLPVLISCYCVRQGFILLTPTIILCSIFSSLIRRVQRGWFWRRYCTYPLCPRFYTFSQNPRIPGGLTFSVRKTFENTCNSVPLSVAYQDPKKKKMTFSNLNSPSFTFVLSFLYLGYLK